MALTNTYCLKMTPSQFGQSSVVVNCSQYDSLFRVIQFNLYNGTNEFSIPDNCVVTIRGTKKDLTGFEYQCEYEDNVVTFPIQNQVTVLPGKVPAEIRVTSGNEIIGSWNFVFLVEESPLDENTIISETDLPLLESALEASAQAESYKNLAEQSATEANASAEEAVESASTATTKAEESAESALKSEGYAVGEQNGEPVDETSIYYHNNAKWYSQSGGGASWGSITGDIDNQTDLIEKFGDYVTEGDFDRVKYVRVEGEDYPITGLFAATEEGISGINIILYDGTVDGKTIFLPDGMGVRTASNTIIAMIPTNVSQLNNDSGYITSAPVNSVNGKTGTVVLSASDVGALPDSTVIPTKTSELQNDSGFITSVPVTSVNNKTGAVNLSASDVGALASNTAYVSSVNGSSGAVTISVPTKTSELTNDSGFLTSAPVSSVDGKTGAVTVLPTGGTTGQVLAKASNTDRDVEWTTPSGGSSEWTLLVDTTLESDQSSSITYRWVDEGGYSEIHYSIVVVGKTELASAMNLIVLTEDNQGNQPRFKIPLATSGYLLVYGSFSTNYLQHLQAKASVGGVTHNCTVDITPCYFTQQGRTGKIVVFWLLNSSTAYLPTGSQIKIWGKK